MGDVLTLHRKTIARANPCTPFDADIMRVAATPLDGPKPDARAGDHMSCRLIGTADLPGVADLLCQGFPRRTRAYWTSGLARLAQLAPLDGLPRFGWLLEASGRPVGVCLLISSRPPDDPSAGIRSNVSSWYVDKEFRLYGAMLDLKTTGRRNVTYVNISRIRRHTRSSKREGLER